MNDEQQAADGLPHPDSDPPEIVQSPEAEVTAETVGKEKVDVICPGCRTQYQFEIDPATASFKFVCQNCNTQTEWNRVG